MNGRLVSTLAASLTLAGALAASQEAVLRGAVDLDVSFALAGVEETDADVTFVPVFSGENPLDEILADASESLGAAIDTARSQHLLTGALFQSVPFLRPAGMKTDRLVLFGAGPEAEWTHETLRRWAGSAARSIHKDHVASASFQLRGRIPPEAAVAAVVEGTLVGLFQPGLHKSDSDPPRLERLLLGGVGIDGSLLSVAERAVVAGKATNFVRSLVVEPANYMTPEILARHARDVAREGGLEIEVLDESQIRDKGMGGVIAVGQGSANPPRFITLAYRPAQPSDVTLAFVGKGVCFDSGGISLKSSAGMYRQKGDMAGGATVLGVMKIVAAMKPGVNVLGIVPAVENLPGPKAQKPGDVFVGYSGKTVEVMSTDAEGRLILSDGISYALDRGATHVVDIATLTGTVRRALGDRHVGAFSNDDALFAALQTASERTGESFWRLPIDEDYARGIRSSLVADLNETGGDAGASVGAKFLQQFVDGRAWIHLDIAGLSWPAYTPPYRAAGPTGVTVRTLAELSMVLGRTTTSN